MSGEQGYDVFATLGCDLLGYIIEFLGVQYAESFSYVKKSINAAVLWARAHSNTPLLVKYNHRVVANRTILDKAWDISRERKLSSKRHLNEDDYRIGESVQVRYDSINSYWKRYKPSNMVGRVGTVVGFTRCHVDFVLGNLWSDNLKIHRKKNGSVSRRIESKRSYK
jgi:hypothetical protein